MLLDLLCKWLLRFLFMVVIVITMTACLYMLSVSVALLVQGKKSPHPVELRLQLMVLDVLDCQLALSLEDLVGAKNPGGRARVMLLDLLCMGGNDVGVHASSSAILPSHLVFSIIILIRRSD